MNYGKNPTSFFSPAASEKRTEARKAHIGYHNQSYVKQQNTEQGGSSDFVKILGFVQGERTSPICYKDVLTSILASVS